MAIAKNRNRVAARSKRAKKSTKGVERRLSAGDKARNRGIADKIRLYMEDSGITRLQLEEKLGRGKSTMDHFFAGDFAPTLLSRVEHALGRQFGESSSVAPEEWGGYTQESTAKFAGSYLTLRHDFKDHSQICAYVTTIEWGDIAQAYFFDGRLILQPKINGYGLIFREERRADPKYTHRGQVWIPVGSFLYLVSAYGDGRLRAAIASLPDIDGRMAGIQLSLFNPKGPAFTPAAAPIAFLRRTRIADEELGNIKPGNPRYENYREIIAEAAEGVELAVLAPAQAS